MATYTKLPPRSINTRNGRPPDQHKNKVQQQQKQPPIRREKLKFAHKESQSFSKIDSSGDHNSTLFDLPNHKQYHQAEREQSESRSSIESNSVNILPDSLEVIIQEQSDNGEDEDDNDDKEENSISEEELRQAAQTIVNGQAIDREKRRQLNRPQNHVCPIANCGKACGNRTSLRRHNQTCHIGLKPFACRWIRCRYSNSQRYMVVSHVRTVHFGQPRTLAKRQEMNLLQDGRNPNDYVAVDKRLLKLMNKQT